MKILSPTNAAYTIYSNVTCQVYLVSIWPPSTLEEGDIATVLSWIRTGASGENVSAPTTGHKKCQKWSAVKLHRKGWVQLEICAPVPSKNNLRKKILRICLPPSPPVHHHTDQGSYKYPLATRDTISLRGSSMVLAARSRPVPLLPPLHSLNWTTAINDHY